MGTLIFLLEWIGLYFLILDTMSRDNLHWISSSPEWGSSHKGKGPVKNYSLGDYVKYIYKDRIVKVWTDGRDIIPAGISSFALACIINGIWILGIGVIMMHWILGAIWIKEKAEGRSWEK